MNKRRSNVFIAVDRTFYDSFLDKQKKQTEIKTGLKFKSLPQFTSFLVNNTKIKIHFPKKFRRIL